MINQQRENEEMVAPEESKCSTTFIFPFVLLAYELLIMLLYGFLFGYNLSYFSKFMFDDLILVSVLMILVLLGFGLMNAYVTNSSFSGIAMTFLIFAFTIQNYFLFRAFWYKIGVYKTGTDFRNERFEQIALVNFDEDSQITNNLPVTSMVDAIACSISLLVAFSPLVGRVGFPEIFFLSAFGTMFYELNNQLFWRFFITDTGYGMRIFLFGSSLGLIISCLQGNKQSTLNHKKYFSSYSSQSLGLIGFCIIICCFPFLSVGGLYQTSENDNSILWIAPLNMWMSLVAGILGGFCSSALMYRKIWLHNIIFGGLAGAIACSSSADLYRNSAFPLSIGFLIGFACTIFNQYILRHWNKSGVVFTFNHLQRFFYPSLICSLMAAILHALGDKGYNSYHANIELNRKMLQQGSFELAGLGFCLGIGLVGGLILGGLIRLFRNTDKEHQFNDNSFFKVSTVEQQNEEQPKND